MNLSIQHHTHLAVRREGIVGRRDFLRGISAAALASGTLGWTDVMSLRAADLKRQGRACILLWMQGGPSQLETFDPKPDHDNGGETKAIATSLPGVQFSENLPHLAKVADQLAIVRSMSTKEGEHQRASFLMHTSYLPTSTVHHPTMGAVAAKEIRRADCELPSFVRIGDRARNSGTGGLLGNEFNPFVVQSATRRPENIRPTTPADRFQSRMALLDRLETADNSSDVPTHRKLYESASQMILSPQMQAFDIDRESDQMRDAYGRSDFGAGCLLARRLVESGVTFVEVALGNWDTHDDNFSRSTRLSSQFDQPFAQLLADLKQRGLLDSTLVVWMGEFGRTPRINPRGGRDHFPRAFSAVLAGGGVKVGQAYGKTSPSGDEVVDSAVNEKDLFQTIYKALRIDAKKENMSPIGRPIRIVDGGAPVEGLLS